MKTVLVTGGAGFIGSHLIDELISNTEWMIVNLDKLTYAADLTHLAPHESNPRYRFIQGDICDKSLVESLFDEYDFEGVLHLAAESHVDNSIKSPEAFIQSNIQGTFVLLEATRRYFSRTSQRFLHVSTDEVFGSIDQGAFDEDSPYQPNSPYSASKASSDLLVRSYHKTYGLNTVITNCSNNFGPRQHQEKLIPTVITKALANQEIPIYGTGMNVRDWLYVRDHARALHHIFECAKSGDYFVIGQDQALTNNDMVKRLCLLLDELSPKDDSYLEQIRYVRDRPGHDSRYAINASKLLSTGFAWEGDFEIRLRQTVQWYLAKLHHQQTVDA